MHKELMGRRLAGRFLEAAHLDLPDATGYAGNVWLTTDRHNNADAIGLYLDHGYEIIDQTELELKMERVP